jgi:hypothetical protein
MLADAPETKEKKSDFKEAMSHRISVLTTPTVRKCNRKAQTYIQASYYLQVMREGEGTQPDERFALSTIEKVQNHFKINRSAIDFNQSFGNGIVNNSV